MSVKIFNRDNFCRFITDSSFRQTILRSANRQLNTNIYKNWYAEGMDVMAQDWDNLIILDACRWDVFNDRCELSGELDNVISRGSNSWEFVRNNFSDRSFHDTIYVTSNVHYLKLSNNPFFYSKAINRIYPQKLVGETIQLHEEYPNKKLITHIMLPHAPYHSKKAQELRAEVEQSEGIEFYLSDDDGGEKTTTEDWDLYSLLNACEKGYISDEDLLHVYKQNVDMALIHTENLINRLDGKSVVTSDHGELLGERLPPSFLKEYGHNGGIYCKGLRSVPWFTASFTQRRDIQTEEPIHTEKISDDVVDQRLKALGYT